MGGTQTQGADPATGATAGTGTGTPPPVSGNITGINFGLGGATGTASAPTTAGGQLVSQDQSTLSQYYLTQIGAYTITPGGLPGALNNDTTVGQALQDLYHLTSAQLTVLQQELMSAGFYENADGSPMTDIGQVSLGEVDDQTWLALGRALGEAATSGSSVMSLIDQRIASGLGATQQTTLPSAVQGGGNVYEIDLTQPGAVNQTTNSIFQAALGRNATPAEIQSVLSAINSGEFQQGYARVAAGENASQQKYQASINQRNIAYEFQKTPKTAFGPVPQGPFTNSAEWASGLLMYMQLPQTPQNIAFLVAFERQMGGNPLNPLQAQNPAAASTPSATGASQFQSIAQGLQATAEELLSPKFDGLYYALQSGNPTKYQGVSPAINSWSNGKFSTVTPTAQENQQGQQQAYVYGISTPQTQPGAAQPGEAPISGKLRSLNAGAGNAPFAPNQQIGTGTVGGAPAPPPGTPAASVNVGQQPPNPGDTYINPTVATIGTPLTPEQAAYQEATTGSNRFGFAENNYLNSFLAAVQMIKAGGPTG